MGIKGFAKFINDRAHLYFENYELRDCNLVIDGHSISCQLYNWNHWQFDARSNNSYGGDYDKYAYIVENFFGMFKEVKVTPIVVFDGGFEQRKLPTILSRMQDKINIANQLNPEYEAKQPNKVVFPLFLREAFKDILRSLDIEMVMCKYEGDTEIASIAKLLDCPVLTLDSDYFLFGAQYIPFKTLNSKVQAIENWRTGTYKCISCKIYRIEKFLEDFQGLQESSLHLLPVLMGNDYIDPKLFDKFLGSINLVSSNWQEQIQGILNWLKCETTESAIRKILRTFKTAKDRQAILGKIEKIVSGYYFVESKLLKYLNISSKSEFKQKNFNFAVLREEINKEPEDDDNPSKNLEVSEVTCKDEASLALEKPAEESNVKVENDKITYDDNPSKNLEVSEMTCKDEASFEKPAEESNVKVENDEITNGDALSDSGNSNEPGEINSPRIADPDSQNDDNKNGTDSANSEKLQESNGEATLTNNFEDDDEEMSSSSTLDLGEDNLERDNASENPISKIFIRNFTKCQYPSSFMDILTQNKYYCIPQIENHVQEHSHTISFEVLCAIHKILTSSVSSDFTVVARGEGSSVKWFPQEKYIVSVPTLEEIEQLTLQGRRDTLLRILNIDGNFVTLLAHIPTEWHTFLISLKYASTKTNFETPLIYALVLCFIILNYVDQRIGYYRSAERYKKKYLSFMQSLHQINEHVPFRADKNCFYYFPSKDCIIFMQKVVHFFTSNPKETAQTFDRNLIHSMAQIQSVMLHIKYLNSLLKSPYPNLLIHQIFDGTLIYNLTKTFTEKSAELQNNYLNVFFKDCPSILAGLKYVLNLLNKQIIL